MTYGSGGEPIKLEGATQVVDAARRSGGVVLCFVPLEYESQLTKLPSIQTVVIGDNTRVALIVVRFTIDCQDRSFDLAGYALTPFGPDHAGPYGTAQTP